ncbi:acyl-CoA dehydrogenase family protein [Cytobacillus oceanisediminis]|uniref:acyl-CoA dehydrogenase family protein n=1 Tax=Cytobacillus TaxID=2675230 RepID=UPI00203F1E0F|nr:MULTISPECIES: acyl-CoA dehydrogenase family protein [Cytobacillus]MBY0156324.1 acyl-CoA dehydrogenase family protein [Cytobacillus firmus]MCM3392426.1 acyl-CoA dehydrogenase family protein [Cytobacillus oceanisediminis]MCM3530809.1 acyl-CoA dehydrogenase family protein [Cytobacillus oceanisediminis]UQX55497.1 acyl-CoA dehydrogenase family protein [Cytobacillus pseudoceanisediminis]
MEEVKTANRGAGFLFTKLNPETLYTPEDFTDEHILIGRTAKQFAEKMVQPEKDRIENQDFELVTDLLRKAGGLGLLAHSIPEKYGGLGLDKISKGIVGESIASTGGYGVAHSNHTCIATLPITYFGTPEQKEKYLPKLASGEYIGAYCLTEPNAGSDALSSQTTAVLNQEGTHYILNGTKIYITNAVFSDTFIVYAKVDGQHFTAFIVERDTPGLSLGPEENKMGIKGSSTRSVIFEDCPVPANQLLGEVGKGHIIALNVLNLGRFNLGSACMGASKTGLKKAIQFTGERKQFGKSIADFPATKEKIAKMAGRIYAAESLQYRTANLLEESLADLYDSSDLKLIGKRMSEYATECAICKVFGSETLDYAADEVLQLHGGAGFIKEYGVEQMYRDSRINRIFEGTNEINRLLIPTHLFRKALKGDIDLAARVEEAVVQLSKPEPIGQGIFEKERAAVNTMRNLFLLNAGLAYEAFGSSLAHEQEALMKLADLAIALYASESAVYRTYKAIQENGEEKEELKILQTRTFIEGAIWDAERLSRQLVSELASEGKRDQLIGLVIRECGRFSSFGKESARNRRIAELVYDKGEYCC